MFVHSLLERAVMPNSEFKRSLRIIAFLANTLIREFLLALNIPYEIRVSFRALILDIVISHMSSSHLRCQTGNVIMVLSEFRLGN